MIAYIVTGPWEDEHTQLELAIHSMGRNPGEAWYKHTRGRPDKVQHWFDKGYRLRKVVIDIVHEQTGGDYDEST